VTQKRSFILALTSSHNIRLGITRKPKSTMPALPDEVEAHAQDSTSAARARKRRIELRKRSTADKDEDVVDDDQKSTESIKRARVDDEMVDPVTSKPRPSLTGIKKQSRYDPGVPLDREELREWRKVARRVRNRESAADSRKRNRDRVTELEGEVDILQSRYSAALQRIVELEAAQAVNDSFTPAILRQDVMSGVDWTHSVGSAPLSPKITSFKTISPPMSPTLSYSVPDEEHHEEVTKKYQHIMHLINRPKA
jgi:hypothetical protein